MTQTARPTGQPTARATSRSARSKITGGAPAQASAAATKSGPALSPKEVFSRLQQHCLAKPDAVEEYPWGDVAWKVRGKLFAVSGQGAAGVTVKASLEDQAVLVQHPAIRSAPYVGRYGWVSIEIGDKETLALACQLIDESYAGLLAAGHGKRAQAKGRAPRCPSAHKD